MENGNTLELSFTEVVEKINDYYCNGTVIITSDFGHCKINIATTDNLQAEETETKILFRDDAGLEFIMDKSDICKSTLSSSKFNEEIIIDFGNSNISLLLYK